jgi:amidase
MPASLNQPQVHAFSDDALGNDDATALARRIRDGEVSVPEVTRAAIERARKVTPIINGIVTNAWERAQQQADQLNAAGQKASAGFFSGVPTFIKDNTDIAGLPTLHGSRAVPPNIAHRTSPITSQLLAQGYLCLGKSALPEFGFNASTEPAHAQPTCNPWNPAFSAGASSGGAAALVAAGVVPVAHANDGGGSIRIPAACCGLVGLKPSRGRLIDNDAAKSLPINIVADGIVSRTVRDTAHFMEQAEHYFHRRGLPPIGQVSGPADKPLKIGLVLDSITGHKTDEQTRQTVETTARILEKMGHIIEPVAVPVNSSFPEDFTLYWALLAFGMKMNGKKMTQPGFDKRQVDGLTNGLAGLFKKQFYRLPSVLWRLKRSSRDYAKAMQGYDAVLTPVLGHTTPRLGHLSPTVPFDTLLERLTRYASFTPLANTTGAPAISLPMSHTADNLPVSVQLMSNYGDERTLLQLAFALEAEYSPWAFLNTAEKAPQAGEIAGVAP